MSYNWEICIILFVLSFNGPSSSISISSRFHLLSSWSQFSTSERILYSVVILYPNQWAFFWPLYTAGSAQSDSLRFQLHLCFSVQFFYSSICLYIVFSWYIDIEFINLAIDFRSVSEVWKKIVKLDCFFLCLSYISRILKANCL